MLLAGDIGGTKILLGLFERADPRPVAHSIHSFPTSYFKRFADILDAFALEVGGRFTVHASALGVAGPVVNNQATLTNGGLKIAADDVSRRFAVNRVRLLNDLEAMASSVAVLTPEELVTLQDVPSAPDGCAAVIAAGTGLGQAYLHRANGRLTAVPTEAGHADFAARTDRELELVRMLRDLYGRAEVEQVLSGQGLVNLHRFTHRGGECTVIDDLESPETPAQISRAAMGGRCQGCAEALRMFVSAYGAEAGNLALRSMAMSGLFVGGGIARKILPAITSGGFMEAFRAKAPMTALVARIPVHVILNTEAGLLGAAVCAQRL
ncbi:MAG TPA: glucokinase [Vicinamibacterales bacterium]|nr:glucokinase [Vicinamibacterales bacterium]